MKLTFAGQCALSTLGFGMAASTQGTPLVVTDSRGVEITFPLGAASFADVDSRYDPAEEIPATATANPDQALGLPDYVSGDDTTFTTLG